MKYKCFSLKCFNFFFWIFKIKNILELFAWHPIYLHTNISPIKKIRVEKHNNIPALKKIKESKITIVDCKEYTNLLSNLYLFFIFTHFSGILKAEMFWRNLIDIKMNIYIFI